MNLLKIITFVFFLSEEELFSPEEDSTSSEDHLPIVDPEDPPLDPEKYFHPENTAPISTDTTVSNTFYQSVPCSSSSALVDPFSTMSGPDEFQMQNREGIFKSDFQSMCLFFPLRFPCLVTSLGMYHIGESAKLRRLGLSLSEPSHYNAKDCFCVDCLCFRVTWFVESLKIDVCSIKD